MCLGAVRGFGKGSADCGCGLGAQESSLSIQFSPKMVDWAFLTVFIRATMRGLIYLW